MSEPHISVVITTYNYGRFVEEAIDSVLAQDFPMDGVEILVIDDGSTDDTQERVKKYGERIHYFRKENGGQASALNFGFAHSSGELVVLLDADDYFLPNKLARVVQAFESDREVAMVYHPLVEWAMDANKRWVTNFPLISGDMRREPAKIYFYRPYPTSAVAFRRSKLDRLLPIPDEVRMTADGFLVELIAFLAPVLAIPDALTVYRIHGENSYYVDELAVPWKERRARLRLRQLLYRAMRRWLDEHGYRTKDLAVRCFVCRWTAYQIDAFLPSGLMRIRSVLYLFQENRALSPAQDWKLTVFNYMTVLLVLIAGHRKDALVYGWRTRLLNATRPIRRALGLRSKAARAAGTER